MKKVASISIKSNRISNLKSLWNLFLENELAKVILFCSISSLSMVKILISPEPLGLGDLSPMWRFSQLFRPFDVPWDYKSNLGTPDFLFGNAMYNLPIIMFSSLFKNTVIAHKLWFILLFTIAGYGFYKLFSRIFESQLIGTIAGIYGIFNKWLSYHLSFGHNLVLFAYAVFPFAVTSYLASLKNQWSLQILFTGQLTALIFYINPPIGYIFFMFALTYAIVDSLFSERRISMLFRNLIRLLSIVTVAFICLLPVVVNVFCVGASTYAIRIEEITHYTFDMNEAFSSQPAFTLQATIQTIVIFSLGGYIAAEKNSTFKNRERAPLMFTLIILSAVGFLLFSGVTPSFLVFLSTYVPGFAMLRELNKTLILGVYLVACVLSIIFDRLKKVLSWNRLSLTLLMLGLIGLSAVYPILSGDFAGSLDTVAVPWHCDAVYTALDSDTDDYRVAFIPPAVWATHHNWSDHFFLDPATSLQAKSTLEIKSEMDCTTPAGFSRWIYCSLFRNRTRELSALLGLTGVKYIIFRKDVYMPNYRVDLRFFSQKRSREILSAAEDIKEVWSTDSIEIFETDRRLPHIYACDKVSLIAGDRRVLLSLLNNDKFDPVSEPPIFIDNLNDIVEIFNYTETIYIDPLRFEDLVLALAQNKIVYEVWKNLRLTSNMHKEWIRGEFAWHMKDGVADTAPDGYAITSSGKPLTLNINIPKTGNYSLLVQCFLIDDETFEGVEISLDEDHLGHIKPEEDSPLGNYRWICMGNHRLNSGFHSLNITPEKHFAAISKIALIPTQTYEKAKENLKTILKNKDLFYIIEDYDWENPDIVKFVEDITFSNGFAVKVEGETSTPIFIPENLTYQIFVRASGYGNVTISVSKEKDIFERKINFQTSGIETSKTSFSKLLEGWNNLNLSIDGDVCIDQVYLCPPQNKTKAKAAQLNVERISGSQYTIENVSSNFVVFLEGWNDDWRLKSEHKATSPLIAFGFANLFKIPEDADRLQIEFQGATLMSTYSKLSLILIGFSTLILFVLKKILGEGCELSWRNIGRVAITLCLLMLIVTPIYVSLNKGTLIDKQLTQNVNASEILSLSSQNWADYARIAWRYYQPGIGVNPTTGLHYANKDWHRFTDWDLGSYLLAILDAEKLGILSTNGEWAADYRINKILDFLQTRPLTSDDLPYLVYNADTEGLPSEIDPRETNVYDTGRLLIALYRLKQHKPDVASTVDWIVLNRCNYSKLVETFPTDPTPETYYIANGFKYFGFNNSRIQEALNSTQRMIEGEQIELYGVTLPNVKLISEQVLHGMFELNPDPAFREIAYRTYLVQQKRWDATGNFTAFTEGAYDDYPYYIYEYIILPPKTWVVMAQGVGELSLTPVIYIKAALGFHALYKTGYTNTLVENLMPQLVTDQGFCEGVDESGRVIQALTDKTNGMIINAARYALKNHVSLSEFPAPFVRSGIVNNTLLVIGESKPRGPCGAAHTIDTLGGMLVTARLGLEASEGQLKSAIDGWLINYNQTTGETEILDVESNLIVFGSPGVNSVAYYYNNTETYDGWVLPNVVFCRNYSLGQNYLEVRTSGKRYYMEFEDGRVTVDYATIEILKDWYGRHVMLVYGLGAEGTRIASEVLRNYEQYDLQGRAVVMKYYDSDDDGCLDTVSIVEVIS